MFIHWSILLCFIVVLANSKSKGVADELARVRLINHLFANYDPHAKPAPLGQIIHLRINFDLQHFNYRQSDGAFNFEGVLNIIWKDPKFNWDPSYYGNISRLTVNQKLVWVPDVEVYNNVADKFLHMHREGMILLENTGLVSYTDSVSMVVFCAASMKYWPYDEHTCTLSMGSWIYDGLEVDMNPAKKNTPVFDDSPIYNPEFKLTNFSTAHIVTKYDCCSVPYVTIDYTIEFKRRAAFATVFHSLAFCMVVLNLLALNLSTRFKLKLLLNACSLMLAVANILCFAGKVGRFARETPLIVTFHCISLVMITGTFLLTVFSIFATRSVFGRGTLPSWITHFPRNCLMNNEIRQYFLSSSTEPEDSSNSTKFYDVKLNEDESNLITTTSDIREWFILAHFMERVIFFIYVIIYSIAGVVCFIF